jgi:hypothetical protein
MGVELGRYDETLGYIRTSLLAAVCASRLRLEGMGRRHRTTVEISNIELRHYPIFSSLLLRTDCYIQINESSLLDPSVVSVFLDRLWRVENLVTLGDAYEQTEGGRVA